MRLKVFYCLYNVQSDMESTMITLEDAEYEAMLDTEEVPDITLDDVQQDESVKDVPAIFDGE